MTTLETVTLVAAITGTACGVLGAVLGIINTWAQLTRNKVRIRVVPKIALMMNANGFVITGDRHTDMMEKLIGAGKPIRLCVEVVNLSSFPITVHDVGFGSGSGWRHSLIHPEISPVGKSFPARLEPRESITAYGGIGDLSLDPRIVKEAKAYAITDCGTVACGSSPIFRDLVQHLANRKA